MKALIFCGGEIEDYVAIKKYLCGDIFICADGGARHMRKLNIVPDLLIGDFDSIIEEDLVFYKENNVRIVKFPQDKDYTDTELAIDEGVDMGAAEIVILGATGGRMDHTLSNVFLLKKMLKKGIKGKIVTANDEIMMIKDFVEIEGAPNDIISLLPFDGDVQGITTKGLFFQLQDETLYSGSSRGVSNVFSDTSCQIVVSNGVLLLVKSRENKCKI
jgi:thiamine pyrophosphokinase